MAEGRKSVTEQQSSKKKTMKTSKKSSSKHSELKSRPEHSAEQSQGAARPHIDFAARDANRALTVESLLNLLRYQAPRFFELAQVVGKWVWIQFDAKQPPQVTCQLAQFGFHWNNKRQCWQHPCGPVAVEASPTDPREKYGVHFPADTKAA